MKFGVIVAARMRSKRLPGKALLPLLDMPMIIFLIKRIKTSKLISKIVFATTELTDDDFLVETVKNEDIDIFRGSEKDVLGRLLEAASYYNIENIIRITGDCPFVDGHLIDYCIKHAEKIKKFDLITTKPLFPRGIDLEIFPYKSMKKIYLKNSLSDSDKEHVTKYIYDNKRKYNYNIYNLKPFKEIENINEIFTVDTEYDYIKCVNLLKNANSIYTKIEDFGKINEN